MLSVAEEARAANKKVLVHCVAGISRSVTVTLAYIMWLKHMSFDEAFEFVRLQVCCI